MTRKAPQFARQSSDAAAQSSRRKQSSQTASFADNSARTSNQLHLIDSIRNSGPAVAQAKQLQSMFGSTAQLIGNPEEEMVGQKKTPDDELHQKKEADAGGTVASTASSTANGLPGDLRSGVEAISGLDMSGVQVHHNSAKPADLNALAYTQGNEIHLGPGQERHLPHEAWHVVQQREGRVSATTQAKGIAINDDAALEQEADTMGARAVQTKAKR